MGYRVVHVNEVKLFGSGYLEYFRSERICVRRVLEQRVAQHIHGVKMNSLARAPCIQSHRRCVAYEMNLVSALGKLQPQLSPYTAAPAVRWIASDSYFHDWGLGVGGGGLELFKSTCFATALRSAYSCLLSDTESSKRSLMDECSAYPSLLAISIWVCNSA